MARLKLGTIVDNRPVKLTVELPANVHRDLLAYAEVLARETGQKVTEPSKLIAPLLAFYGDRSRFRKNPSGNSSVIDRERITLA